MELHHMTFYILITFDCTYIHYYFQPDDNLN